MSYIFFQETDAIVTGSMSFFNGTLSSHIDVESRQGGDGSGIVNAIRFRDILGAWTGSQLLNRLFREKKC